MTLKSRFDTLVTVLGGSGFVGRHVVRALANRHYRIRVAVRRPELCGHLQPLGRVGQIHAVQANVRYPQSVAAVVRDADVVVNLVGILFERSRQRFDAVQAEGAVAVAHAAGAGGARMIHVSAIGADATSTSHYARSKAEGEQQVLAAHPAATIMDPAPRAVKPPGAVANGSPGEPRPPRALCAPGPACRADAKAPAAAASAGRRIEGP